jgi:hypothetical protein
MLYSNIVLTFVVSTCIAFPVFLEVESILYDSKLNIDGITPDEL